MIQVASRFVVGKIRSRDKINSRNKIRSRKKIHVSSANWANDKDSFTATGLQEW